MPVTPPLSVVVIGCGAVTRQLYSPALQILEKSGAVRVVAVVDPVGATRAHLAAQFPRAQSVGNLNAVAKVDRGALAIIASPAARHCEQAIGCASRGWHILCEKPLAARSSDCAVMIQAAEEAGVRFAVGHYRRFFSAARALKELCAGRTPLGPLLRFTVCEGGPFDWPAASPAIFRREETPGGVLLDLGVDVLDLLTWWLGEPLDHVYADDAMGGLEINAHLTLRFSDANGQIRLSRDWETPNRYSFEFARGRASWSVNEANGLAIELQGIPFTIQGRLSDANGAPTDNHPQSFLSHLRQVVTAVCENIAVPVEARAGARILRLIESCYTRRRFLVQPWLAANEEQTARRLSLSTR